MKRTTKLLSVLLTVALVASSLFAFTASAATDATMSENFDNITDIASQLNGQTVNGLTWAFSTGSWNEYHQLETRANNGNVIRVNGNDGKKNAEVPLWQVYSGLDYSETAKELNLSLDVKMDKGAYYDLTLASSDLTEADALAKGGTIFFSFTRWAPGFRLARGTGATIYSACTENQWYNIGLKQQKLSDGTFKKIWYVDGTPVNVVTDATEYQFDKLVLSGGACEPAPWAYNFSVDNVKFWSSDEYSATMEKHIDTAEELKAAAGGNPGLTLSDVPAGYGKPAGDMAIELTATGNGNASPVINLTPNADEDIVVEFDLLIDNPITTADFHFGFDWADDTYTCLRSGKGTLNSRNLGYNQWNNLKFRAFRDAADGVYKWSCYYNGVFIETKTKPKQDDSLLVEKFWLWMQGAGSMRIDNLCIKTLMNSQADAYCKQDVHKVTVLDWAGIPDGAYYGRDLFNSGNNASLYAQYHYIYDATGNSDNVTGIGYGKANDDNALKIGRTANSNPTNMRFTLDTNQDIMPAFKPGSKVIMGASIHLGKNFLAEDAGRNRYDRIIELYTATDGSVALSGDTLAGQINISSAGLMRYSGADKKLKVVTGSLSSDKWYRIEYEILVATEDTPNLLNIYIDGVKVNDEPMSIGADLITDSMLHCFVNHGSLNANDKELATDFYVDDASFEYIPAGEEAYNPIAANLNSTNEDIVIGKAGIISLVDKASTEQVAFYMEQAIEGATVSAVNASGQSLMVESAKGAYLKVNRSGLPAVFYLANDLSVNASSDKVSVDMRYSADGQTVVYIAVYNEDGSLADVAMDASGDGLLRAAANLSAGQTYKVFLWTGEGSMKPYF